MHDREAYARPLDEVIARSETSLERGLSSEEARTRLEKLGAKRIEKVKTWWVMEAPTGQRFCVIRAKTDLAEVPTANPWT